MNLLKKNTDFRKFFCATIVSNIGDYVDDIVFVQLVYLITKSTLFTSYVFAIKMVFVFFSIFMATLADRLNKKKLMVFSYIMQACVLIIVTIMYKSNRINFLVLLLTVTMQALFSSILVPTQNAVLSCIVKSEDVVDARALINVVQQFVQIIAYGTSATLISFIGIEGALGVDIITFLVAVIFYLFIRVEDVSIPFKDFGDYKNELKQGFHFVKTSRIILGVMICSLMGNFLTAPVDSLIPVYLMQNIQAKSTYSIFMCILTTAGAFCGIILPKIRDKFLNETIFAFGFGIGAVGIGLLFFQEYIVVLVAAMFIGSSYTIVSVLNASILQLCTPKNMIARTFSIFKCMTFMAGPIGTILGGVLGEIFSLNQIFLGIAFFMLVLAVMCKTLLNQ